MVPQFSNELIEWASRAGMTPSIFESSGAACFADGGGEYRYYTRQAADGSGWYAVTYASRDGEERSVFSARDLKTVERYLWATFGADIRSVQRLPRLAFPKDPKDTAPGYSVVYLDDGRTTLVDEANRPVVRAEDNDVTDISLLVKLSYLLGVSTADLKTSFTDPLGRPVFPIRSEG